MTKWRTSQPTSDPYIIDDQLFPHLSEHCHAAKAGPIEVENSIVLPMLNKLCFGTLPRTILADGFRDLGF